MLSPTNSQDARNFILKTTTGSAAVAVCWSLCCAEVAVYLWGFSDEFGSCGKFEREMSGQAVSADFSEHMLDMDEDEDLEVFSKVKRNRLKTRRQLRTHCFKQSRCVSCYVDLTLAPTHPLEVYWQKNTWRSWEVPSSPVRAECTDTTYCHVLEQLMSWP